MKILHVWDNAGVAAILAKYQRLLGHHVAVIKRLGFDKCGIDAFYKTDCFAGSAFKFYRIVRKLAKDFDILHIHSLHKACLFVPFSKKLLEYHGTEIRTYDSLLNKFCRKALHRIVVSTPDLLSLVHDAVWLPNPVDSEHFHPIRREKLGALYLHNWFEDEAWAEAWAKQNGIRLTILDRAEGHTIPYSDMPDFLSRYTHLIDRKAINSLSKTALEALSCGLRVVRGSGSVFKDLPSRHEPANVAKQSIEIYKEILN